MWLTEQLSTNSLRVVEYGPMMKIDWAAKSQNRLLFADLVYETSSFSQKESPLESIDSNSLVINLGMEMS